MLAQFTVYAKTIYLLMVVMSGALCTVEDYVIMSQCAHNKAIHLAAEGTVSATDISQTQNITIVGLPDFVNNDFKIALYAKETQRYLCFNEHWKLVGMKELRDTCYFNETIVHGYFVFRSVVDLKRRIGFTQRGKAVGPKKNVNDACYMFTKIPTDQFFHQHMKQLFDAHRRNGNANNKSPPIRYNLENTENVNNSNNGNDGYGGNGGNGSGGGNDNKYKDRDIGDINVPTKADKREKNRNGSESVSESKFGSELESEFGSGQTIERSEQYNRHKNTRFSIVRNNNKTNLTYRRHQYQQKKQQQQQQQQQKARHISNLSFFKQNSSELSSSNRNLAISNYGREPHYTTTIHPTHTYTHTYSHTHSHTHQVRHHHNDPNAVARRHQHEQKLKRKQQQQEQQNHKKPSLTNANTTMANYLNSESTVTQTRTQTAFKPLVTTMTIMTTMQPAYAAKSLKHANVYSNISKDVKLTTTIQQRATKLTKRKQQQKQKQHIQATKRYDAISTVSAVSKSGPTSTTKRKGRQRQSNRTHRKHMQQHLQQRLQHEREHIYLLKSKTLKQHVEPPSTTPHTWLKPALPFYMSTIYDNNQDIISSTQSNAPFTMDDIPYSSTTEYNTFTLSDEATSPATLPRYDNDDDDQNDDNDNDNDNDNDDDNDNENENSYGDSNLILTTTSTKMLLGVNREDENDKFRSKECNYSINSLRNVLLPVEATIEAKMYGKPQNNSIMKHIDDSMEGNKVFLMELWPSVKSPYEKLNLDSSTTTTTTTTTTIETIIKESIHETYNLNDTNELIDDSKFVKSNNKSEQLNIDNITLTTSNENLMNAYEQNQMNDINSTYMTLPSDSSLNRLYHGKRISNDQNKWTTTPDDNVALNFNNVNVESTYQTINVGTSQSQPFIKMNTTNSKTISSPKSMTDYIYKLHNNTILIDNTMPTTINQIQNQNQNENENENRSLDQLNHKLKPSRIYKMSMASIEPLLNDTLSFIKQMNTNTGHINDSSFDNMLPLTTTALTLLSSLPNALRNATIRNKPLKNFTQKLFATPFHHLINYVHNKDDDIDINIDIDNIDNIENISIHPGILSLDKGKTANSIQRLTNSSNDPLQVLIKQHHQQHHQQQQKRLHEQIADSRLTMISGYLPTSATSALPESIRLAKIKINRERERERERKRLLNSHNSGKYT